MPPFDAVIFDMDGVLVDGEPLHFQAVNQILADEGLAMTLEEYRPTMGTKHGWREMAPQLGLRHPVEHYSARFRDLMTRRYGQRSLPLPGAVELVRSLGRVRVPLALCSSSIRPWVDACLSKIGLADHFEAIVTGDQVGAGKPDPEIYLLAARRLGLDPARCLAIEDAPAGILSARAAGMECWAVRTEYTRGLHLPSPQRVFESLLEINLADIVGVNV